MEITEEIAKDTQEDLSADALTTEQGEIIIEEITRNHKLLHRHRLSQNNISIGRGYQNDIILTDPHICRQHLSLRFDHGVWHLEDDNSVNGTRLEGVNSKQQVPHQQIINDGDVITLGKSQLRVLFKDHEVAETVVLSPFESLIDIIRHPIVVLMTIALFLIISAHTSYLNQLSEVNISQLFVGAVSMGLLFATWPAGVSLVSHLTKNEPRVLAQFSICFIFFILMWFSDQLEKVIAFNSSSDSMFGLFFTLLPVGLAFSLFWLNSYIGFHVSAKRRMVVALSITALLFGGSFLLQYSKKPEFNPYPQYNATIMAPSFLIAPSSSVDQFITEGNKLFDQAKKSIQKDDEK